jgi:hypothetical protein
MAEPDRDALLRSIEDFEATLAELQSNNVVLATPVLLRRLEELETSAVALGDPALIAMLEKLRRVLTEGKGLDGRDRPRRRVSRYQPDDLKRACVDLRGRMGDGSRCAPSEALANCSASSARTERPNNDACSGGNDRVLLPYSVRLAHYQS